MLLIAGALCISLLSYLYVGTNIIIDDKASYLYDYNLARVKTAADGIENRMERALATGKLAAGAIGQGSADLPLKIFEQGAKDADLTALVILRPSDSAHFQLEMGLGRRAADLEKLRGELGWTPSVFEKEKTLLSAGPKGEIRLGSQAFDGKGNPLAIMTELKIDPSSLETGRNSEVQLFDAKGSMLTPPGQDPMITAAATAELAQSLLKSTFASGVRDWKSGAQEYLVGYQLLGSHRLLLVSFLPRELAFAAAKSLSRRSIILGVSILLIAIGLTLIFVRGLTRRIQQMWQVTKKVSEGDFTVRVEVGKRSNDEIGDLARSFNVMAERIDQLMAETAEKARMEKELETAQVIQNRLFPRSNLEGDKFRLAGKFVPASECAGDWWYYHEVQGRVVVVVGDVTGHGVASALVTAAAHGAFSIVKRQLEQVYRNPAQAADPKTDSHVLTVMIEEFNTAIHNAAQGKATMTFVACILDLSQGQITVANAGHHPPYVYRKKGESKGANVLKNFVPLMSGQGQPLGDNPKIEVEPTAFPIKPGDSIFWYTDGLLENPNAEGECMSKRALFQMMSELCDANPADATKVCDTLVEKSIAFMGEAANHRPDDVTVVVGSVPASVVFEKKVA